MIHQLIFAAPKPGMSDKEFQDYWLNVHAVKYASKIPQIRKYKIDTVLPFPALGEPLWSGIAEIWLANEEEQLASLQTKEFLEGARLDEPRWAAFWRTLVLDTDAYELAGGPDASTDPAGVKLVSLVKRKEGLPLEDFRERSRTKHADLVTRIPGLRRYMQGHTRDGAYGIGEAVLDSAHQLWFDNVDALSAALNSPEFRQAEEDLRTFTEPRYIHRLVVREHWVIGPEPR
ncbi:EthD family reductase [Nonomuraea sp. NBC_00507]|uniref:EthD domain-containing protein n=1 Tax=Nonomuraea sp. NBC_00507 TaxID=2976002 RepID=UPI002E18FF63